MIKSFRRFLPNNVGAATLILAVVLLVASSLIIIFAANFARTQSTISANFMRQTQAYEAAEAGLQYGINYLQVNRATILANPVSGYIPAYSDSNTSNVVLANNSRYTITYANVVANNYNLIRITSTGTSDDGLSTRVLRQDIEFGSLLLKAPVLPVITKGAVTMSGSANVINTQSNTTIQSGSTVGISGNAQTTLQGGTGSWAGHINADVSTNNTTISNMSQNDFFVSYFGVPASTVQGSVDHYYSSGSSQTYNSILNGMTGTSIWIDQTGGTATISNSVIGSASNPVILIVNGRLSLSGNVTIYGFVFVIGENDINSFSGNTSIIGGIATTQSLTMSGSIDVTYDPTVLSNLQLQSSMTYYAKVAGSWRDF